MLERQLELSLKLVAPSPGVPPLSWQRSVAAHVDWLMHRANITLRPVSATSLRHKLRYLTQSGRSSLRHLQALEEAFSSGRRCAKAIVRVRPYQGKLAL